jgi:c-di-GMP-binding flagellar brake protein YcgR
MEDRRQFMRLSVLADVVYSRHNSSQEEKLAITRNVSKGGICFIAYEKLNNGELLDLKVFLPEQSVPVEAIGKVCWVREFLITGNEKYCRYDAGVEFVSINDADIHKIEKFEFSPIIKK